MVEVPVHIDCCVRMMTIEQNHGAVIHDIAAGMSSNHTVTCYGYILRYVLLQTEIITKRLMYPDISICSTEIPLFGFTTMQLLGKSSKVSWKTEEWCSRKTQVK